MWPIHYGLHFTIIHSLFKSPSQLWYKKGQNTGKKALNIFLIQTVHPLNSDTKNFLLVFKNQKERKSSNSQFLTTNSYSD